MSDGFRQGKATYATLPFAGKTALTISPVGTAQGFPTNNNADFGPDTPGTTTSGIQEAINTGYTNFELLNVTGYNFLTSTSILLPAGTA